ncbi:complex I subunit 1/NuoH family protein [Penaeicola halotolerans]|uniref:complex I subunit 1/NuoH family protein n=1 Tax=Penaeicola halotolerans TaxID=2793196 RepID=UPI001CF8942E|nr:complex I subunit 1 family protein [Penaeicola halotolerans]
MTFLFYLPLILVYAVFAIYAERKIAAFIQDRLGPMEVGRYGLLQTVADLLKLLQKEDIIPAAADRFMFRVAPFLIFVSIFVGFSVLPVSASMAGSGASTGLYFLLAFVSLDVLGMLFAGWGSNNKYALYGAMRSVAQIVSYEIPLSLSVLSVIVLSQSLDLQEISFQQSIWSDQKSYLLGISALGEVSSWGGFFTWNIIRLPILVPVFVIYFIASLAESNRAPFDLAEAESELIGGFHTEYSGFRWALIMLAEYGMMLLVSILAAILFLGSWNSPLPNIGTVKLAEWTNGSIGTWTSYAWGSFWLLSKAFLLIFVQMWVRWTYPRLRVDQLMNLCWKYLTPAALLLLLLSAVWVLSWV